MVFLTILKSMKEKVLRRKDNEFLFALSTEKAVWVWVRV